jgi:hypothetical protein
MVSSLKTRLSASPILLRIKAKLDNIRKVFTQGKEQDLQWLTKKIIWQSNMPFTFVEIGVFKGDNAVSIIRLVKSFNVEVRYIGFDLFDDIDHFFDSHPADRANYDTDEYTYWEFKSGAHALDKVSAKLSGVLNGRNFSLIKGDSTITVPAHLDEIYNASMIYIDGCHDYDIVSKDWRNICQIVESNPDVVIVFDDTTYEGVNKLRREIELSSLFKVFTLNYNQFFVVSHKSKFMRIFRGR